MPTTRLTTHRGAGGGVCRGGQPRSFGRGVPKRVSLLRNWKTRNRKTALNERKSEGAILR